MEEGFWEASSTYPTQINPSNPQTMISLGKVPENFTHYSPMWAHPVLKYTCLDLSTQSPGLRDQVSNLYLDTEVDTRIPVCAQWFLHSNTRKIKKLEEGVKIWPFRRRHWKQMICIFVTKIKSNKK